MIKVTYRRYHYETFFISSRDYRNPYRLVSFIHPFTTTAMIGWIIAIIIFLSGFTSLMMFSSSFTRSPWYLLQGILSIIFGIILLSSSVMSLSSAVMTIAAYWFLISGILRLIGGFQMHKAGFYDANRF